MIYKSIAIDGPAASGKSAVGKLLADKLSYSFLDTGIMYRAVTYLVEEINMSPENASTYFKNKQISISLSKLRNQIFYKNADITDKLFTDKIDSKVSDYSKIKLVRENLVLQQKKISEGTNIVMVGRDIGTKVLPNSDLKVYLDASLEIRAQRRVKDQDELTLEEVKKSLESRDVIDKNRDNSPLIIDKNAYVINTDKLDILEVVDQIITIYK
ncbi:MAG: (d)CMP kinase [SAR202 cluster bacterium]|nr:(d)CMP kinase [SAR202 cluster bacterium]|tara:strand:- start:587 stop:1225 length:639 start_codon:yes stop_codon:yes gene_type:complete